MNVIGHYNPAAKFIEAFVLSPEQGADHGAGYIWPTQPLRTGGAGIKNLVEG